MYFYFGFLFTVWIQDIPHSAFPACFVSACVRKKILDLGGIFPLMTTTIDFGTLATANGALIWVGLLHRLSCTIDFTSTHGNVPL